MIEYAFNQDEREDSVRLLHYIGHVDLDGYAIGPYWTSAGFNAESTLNNGFFYGEYDEQGQLSGQMAFIFPDLVTAYYGQFVKGIMTEGRVTKIVAERCEAGVKRIRLKKVQPEDKGS